MILECSANEYDDSLSIVASAYVSHLSWLRDRRKEETFCYIVYIFVKSL